MTQDSELRRKGRYDLIIKAGSVMMTLGVIVAAFVAGITCYLNSQRPLPREELQAWSRLVIWIWPSGIMMLVTKSSGSVGTVIILVSSLIVNGFLYALVGVLVAAFWKKLTT